MKNVFALLTATAAVGLAVSAYAADESAKAKSTMDYKKNGGYESTASSEETDINGTAKSSKTDVDVDVSSDGRATKTVKNTSTEDPKGLMNKKKHTAKIKTKEKKNGGYEKTAKIKDTDAAGTDVTTEAKTNVDVDANGNVTATTKTEKVTDPKGLMNKTKEKTETKTVNGEVVEEKTSK